MSSILTDAYPCRSELNSKSISISISIIDYSIQFDTIL